MSPAQNEQTLAKNYFLALSTLRESQKELFMKDHQVIDVGKARMKLVIDSARLSKLPTKK